MWDHMTSVFSMLHPSHTMIIAYNLLHSLTIRILRISYQDMSARMMVVTYIGTRELLAFHLVVWSSENIIFI